MSHTQAKKFGPLTHRETIGSSKLELDVVRIAHQRPGEAEKPFAAIVKVNQPDYVPTCVELRTRISSRIFTAQVTPASLQTLEEDPAVVSISPSQKLRFE